MTQHDPQALTKFLTKALADTCSGADALTDALAQQPVVDGIKDNAVSRVRAWRPAVRLSVRATEWATRVLPRGDRPHYRELYRSELTELAQGTHPRRTQASYAIRVLLHTLPLRRTLRTPVPAAQQRTR